MSKLHSCLYRRYVKCDCCNDGRLDETVIYECVPLTGDHSLPQKICIWVDDWFQQSKDITFPVHQLPVNIERISQDGKHGDYLYIPQLKPTPQHRTPLPSRASPNYEYFTD